MSKVLILTFAYNAQQTIVRTIESVLNQQHNNFTYVIADNGSLDNTGDIIRRFAAKDKRIVPVYALKNNTVNVHARFLMGILTDLNEYDYFVNLDADDEYLPTFISDTVPFLRDNDLDFAACRSDFICEDTGENLNNYILEENILVCDELEFSSKLSDYYRFVRALWGTLYSMEFIKFGFITRNSVVSIVNDFYEEAGDEYIYGKDNIAAFKILENSKRFGVLAKILHKYYVRQNSLTYTFDTSRSEADVLRLLAFKEFLTNKCGYISNDNLVYIYTSYLKEISDSSRIIVNANISEAEKELHLRKILDNGETSLSLSSNLFPDYLKQNFYEVLSSGGFGHLI